jgi:hypothetical protein
MAGWGALAAVCGGANGGAYRGRGEAPPREAARAAGAAFGAEGGDGEGGDYRIRDRTESRGKGEGEMFLELGWRGRLGWEALPVCH